MRLALPSAALCPPHAPMHHTAVGLELEFDMDTSPGYAKGSEGNLYFSFPVGWPEAGAALLS